MDLARHSQTAYGIDKNSRPIAYGRQAAYTETIATALTETLTRLSHLATSQLAGQIANVDFWAREVAHGRELLVQYDERFRRQKQAQKSYQEARGAYALQQYQSTSDLSGPPLKRGLKSARIKELDRELVDAFRAFLQRCIAENVLSRDDADTCWSRCCSDRDLEG